MTEKIRVLIADDQDISRYGMKLILSSDKTIEIVGEASTSHEAIQMTINMLPDILLLDLKWFENEQAGIEAIQRLRREAPTTKIIAITIYRHLIEAALKAGAPSALNKEIPGAQLLQEIHSVHALKPAQEKAAEPPSVPLELLTKRELQVLELIADGKLDKEIAGVLGIEESTVKNHVGSILSKLGVHNRAGAVAVGIRQRLMKKDQH